MADLVIGQAEFLAAEQESDAGASKLAAEQTAGAFQPMERLVRRPIAEAGGADGEMAVHQGLGQGWEDSRGSQQFLSADGGNRLAKCGVVRIYKPEIEEAEVGHRSRDGADVQRVACVDEHNGQPLPGIRVGNFLHLHQNPIFKPHENSGTFPLWPCNRLWSGMIDTEAALVEKMRRGDEAAFEALYARHQPAVYRYALRMTGSPDMADDAVQETFLSLLRNRGFNSGAGSLRAYLYGTARHLLFRMWGARDRLEELEADYAGESPDPLEGLELAAQAERVRLALAGLPPHYREAVVMCDLEEMTYAEVAGILGCAVGTVRSRLNRARAMLLDRLSAERCRA